MRDGRAFGVTSGPFRARWWNYYERALSFGDGRFWEEAEADLRTALRLRGEDQRRARTYGMHFIDYFPHRELGIVLFHEGRYEEALRELDSSLRSEKSAKAEYYVDCTRASLIGQAGFSPKPPEIRILSPLEHQILNAASVALEGTITDDSFVKSVEVNGMPVRIDLSNQKLSFRKIVPLKAGENLIRVVATNLAGKSSVEERRVRVDRQGPVLTIDEPSEGAIFQGAKLRLKGFACDESGIEEIRINGRNMVNAPSPEIVLDCSIDLPREAKSLVVEARDRAGNQTKAEIHLTNRAGSPRRVMVASLDLLHLVDAAGSSEPESGSPAVELKKWTDEQIVFLDQVYLEGYARDENGIERLTINGQSVPGKAGKSVFFNHLAMLREGENLFKIEAKNAKGNGIEKQIRIRRKAQKVREIGSRLAVALIPLERKGFSGAASDAVEEKLLGELVERARFEMVERRRLEEILREQKLGQSELADPGAAIRAGKIAAANCVLMGSTVEKEGSLEVYLRLVDTQTSRILAAVDVYGEEASPQELQKLARGLVLKLCDEIPLIEGSVVEIKGSRIIVDIGRESRIKKGMRLIIFKEGDPVFHPLTGALLGADTEELAHGTVEAVRDQISDVETLEKDAQNRIKPMQKVITQ